MEFSQSSVSKRYNCLKCGFETDYIVHFKSHSCSPKNYEKYSVESDSNGWLAQPTCHQNISSKNSSYQRVKKRGKFCCSDCGYSCKSFGLLKLHKNIHYQGLFKCSRCSFITNFENLFRMHKAKHTSAKYGIQEVKNKSFYSEIKNETTIDTSNDLECNATMENENNSPVKLNDGVEMKNNSNSNGLECPICPFRALKINSLGNHLNRFHSKKLSVDIGNFLGLGFIKPHIRNSLSPEEIVSLTKAMKVSNGVMGKSNDIFAQIDASEVPTVKSAIEKIKSCLSSSEPKKLNTWTKEEKLEIYWCDVFSRNALFPKSDISKRRRRALLERGVLSAQKLKETPDSLLHSITANIKICKSSVTGEEALAVIEEVENFIKSKVNSADKSMIESLDFEYLFKFDSVSQNKKLLKKIRKRI